MANASQSAQTAASFLYRLGVDLHLDNSGTAYRQPCTRYGREYDRSNATARATLLTNGSHQVKIITAA